MSMRAWYRFAAYVIAMCMAFSLTHRSIADEQSEGEQSGQQQQEVEVLLVEEPGQEGAEGERSTATVTLIQQQGEGPEYWLGVVGEPVTEPLKAQLKLDGGVVVMNVTEN